MIKAGHARKIRLGNIEAMRDWGYAKDYVVAMYNMMQHDTPDDFVIASGVSHSVRKFLDLTFKMMGLNYENYLEIDKNFFRPTDVNALVGDSHKAKSILGWENKTSFEELVQIMVESDWAQENSTKQDYFI
jgi:GDPmannose 4,6-dehydratase